MSDISKPDELRVEDGNDHVTCTGRDPYQKERTVTTHRRDQWCSKCVHMAPPNHLSVCGSCINCCSPKYSDLPCLYMGRAKEEIKKGEWGWIDGMAAIKDDTEKLRYDLIPSYALEELAKVYTYGAKKYAPRNWEKGLKFSRLFSALMRHSWAYWKGEDTDPETGLHHMAHAAFSCLALVHFFRQADSIPLDDRPKSTFLQQCEEKMNESRSRD